LCSNYILYAERFAKKTQDEKRFVCKRLMKELGPDRIVESIEINEIQKFIDRQVHSRSANAANKDRKNLSAMWSYGMKFHKLSDNPAVKTDGWPHDRAAQYTPSYDDVIRLIMAATRTEKVFLDCYLQTGARRAEIFRWTWHEDIDFTKKQVRLGTKKTRDGSMNYVHLPMTEELYDSLMWWWNNRPIKDTPYVFVIDDKRNPYYGQPYKYRQRFIKGLCRRAGIRPFGFHGLRRFVASLLDHRKYPLGYIQRVLRHAQPSTTDRYLKDIRADMASLDEGLKVELKIEKPDEGANKDST
jgi:integrase